MSDTIPRINAALEGRYRIERELGEGGMATVYLADDLKHERRVALKVLKPELAAAVGAERFLAEIKTTANLQHPHILPLFDSGEADSFLFYVMPYVEGETLRSRIDREGQLAVGEAVRIATCVANALQVAHDAGIVHRDVKPANILLSGGEPLVADFGIALAVGDGGRLTQTGLSVGTPYYMSPEQATDDHGVGPSADTYSLGCVLYEMLVGEPPFTGRTAEAVLGKIIQGDPISATSVRKSLPPNIDAAIRKALERIPVERFATARDFARALNDPAFRYGRVSGTEARARRRQRTPLSLGTSLAAVAFACLAGWALLRTEPSLPSERFESPFRAGQEPVDFGSDAFALSPDGSLLIYRGPSAQASARLWVRRWSTLEAQPIRGTEGGVAPSVSPDGREVAFAQGGAIRVAALEGGAVRVLMPGHRPMWGSDGYIYAANDEGLVRISPAGGEVQVVGARPSPDVEIWPADILPDGETLLITIVSPDELSIGLLGGRNDQVKTIASGTLPHLTSSGHLVYVLEGDLVAAEFNGGGAMTSTTPVVLVEGVVAYSLSTSGRLFYSSAPEAGTNEFVWITRNGQATPVDPGWSLDTGSGGVIGWQISPDGTRLALRRDTEAGADIWIKDLGDGTLSRLTFDEGEDWAPRWTPDGQSITFVSDREVDLEVWSKRADGTGEAERLFDYDGRVVKAVWSPDGKRLVLRRSGRGGGSEGDRDLLVFEFGVDTVPVPLVATPDFAEQAPALSPDGRWLAYSSDETGGHEVFVRPFPNVDDGKWQVSSGGGTLPLWSRDGTELFYVGDPRSMISATFVTGPTFRIVSRDKLFNIPPGYEVPVNGDPYDVTADGQRFLMARVFETDSENIQRVVLVTNFLDDLERRFTN